jgi:hypothetical protein
MQMLYGYSGAHAHASADVLHMAFWYALHSQQAVVSDMSPQQSENNEQLEVAIINQQDMNNETECKSL